MGLSVTAKLLAAHAVNGVPAPDQEITLRVDETLLQDATGTMVMLELEAMGITGTKVSRSVQYVDHNLLQGDVNNANDQRFLASAARRFGVWYSPAGNGISHVVHMQRFGTPGRLLLGSDSHTCAAGALGMFGIGMGGLDVAQVMAGSPLRLPMPRIRQIWLTGALSKWSSAKDVILALLRRHGVAGGVGWVFEYDGPGLAALSVTDRYVIANMGAEIGATASIFPSDGETRRYLREQGREQDWTAMTADPDAGHDDREELDLSSIPPLIALPSSPGNVVEVAEVAGRQVDQVVVGSSANPGLRDFSVVAAVLANTTKSGHVSLEINPSSRRTLGELTRSGALLDLINAGGRIHQAGCLGCVGIGQVPGTGMVSLRTMPRNFPGRSGSAEDQVYLCSPETAAAAALRGVITDPRELGEPPSVPHYERGSGTDFIFVAPSADATGTSAVHKPPNIGVIPAFDPLPDALDAPALLLVGDDISTDDIIPGGAEAMPLRSNIERSAAFTFRPVDPTFYQRALAEREHTGGFIVAGANYGQGSSREHAALLPRFLGIHAVIALSFARIHRQNLINFGVLPLTVDPASDGVPIGRDDRLRVERLRERIAAGAEQIVIDNMTRGQRVLATVELSDWQRRVLLSGGVMNELRESPVPSEGRQSITVSPA